MKVDPTRTTMLRKKFMVDLRRRMESIKRAIYELIVVEDVFGLKAEAGRRFFSSNSLLVVNQRWRFLTTTQKVENFRRWLKQQYASKMLDEQRAMEDGYWRKYIDEGFRKGAGRAFDDTRGSGIEGGQRKMDFVKGTKGEFLRSAFGQPETIDKVKLLAGRVFTELEGITQHMATKMSRTLTDGLVQGKNPLAVARDLTKEIDISRSRAETIARTEIIRAHAEGQLTALEKLGVTRLAVMVEWSTSRDERVCPKCQPMQGAVFTIKEARGMLPRHPNCRCAWKPANLGESKLKQLRGKDKLSAAVRKSIAAERRKGDNTPIDQLMKQSSWQGADVDIAKERPTSLVKPRPAAKGNILGRKAKASSVKFRIEAMPPHFRYGSALEKRTLLRLADERKAIEKKVKAGTATAEELAQLQRIIEERDALRAELQRRMQEAEAAGKAIPDGSKRPRKTTSEPPEPSVRDKAVPSHITYTGKSTPFSRKVWKAVGNGIEDANHARKVGKLIQKEVNKDPHVKELIDELAKANDSGNLIDIINLKRNLASRRREAYHKYLRQVRDFDSDKLSFHSLSSRKTNILFNKGAKFLPDDWTNAVSEGLELNTKRTARGYFQPPGSGRRMSTDKVTTDIAISGANEAGDIATAAHELVHATEWAKPELFRLQEEFIKSRIKPGEVMTSINGRSSEVGYEDKFSEHYCGRWYPAAHREVMSMGASQALIENYYGILNDTDYMDFVLGILAGF